MEKFLYCRYVTLYFVAVAEVHVAGPYCCVASGRGEWGLL